MWTLLMLAAVGQLDPLYGPLPGLKPAEWSPAASVAPPPGLDNDGFGDITGAYRPIPTTADATAWVVQEVVTRKALEVTHPSYWSPADVRYKRFVWFPPWADVTWLEAHSLVVNSACNRSNLIKLPELSADGRMAIWDLRQLASGDHLRRLLIVWDALAVGEPYFHARLPVLHGKQQVAASRAYQYVDGKTYHGRIFIPAPHVEPGYTLLENEIHSFAPLVRADDFLRRMSSTIDGGLYYHAIGFIRDGKRLNEEEIFREVGLSVLLSRKTEGDDRAAVFMSGVTGKPRLIEQVQGTLGRARLTYDIFREDTNVARHAIYQLIDAVDKARGKEIIYDLPNGLFGYLITDGKGVLVDVAPPNLVTDRLVPDPHEKLLYPMESCIRCHGPSGGVQVVRNDVQTLLDSNFGEIDYFDELKQHADRIAIVDRVTGLFAAGDSFQADLVDSRNSYADAVFRATRGSGPRGDIGVVTKAHENYSTQIADYWYARGLTEAHVSSERACLEWGFSVRPGTGAAVLRQLMPHNRIDVELDGRPIEFVDPAIGALKNTKVPMTITRKDLERIFAYGAYQLQQSQAAKK